MIIHRLCFPFWLILHYDYWSLLALTLTQKSKHTCICKLIKKGDKFKSIKIYWVGLAVSCLWAFISYWWSGNPKQRFVIYKIESLIFRGPNYAFFSFIALPFPFNHDQPCKASSSWFWQVTKNGFMQKIFCLLASYCESYERL